MTRRGFWGVILLAPFVALGQEFRATISGSVADIQGAAISSAKIVATEVRTGTRSETASDSAGQYTLPFLAPGEYSLAAEVSGFNRFERKGLTLGSGDHPVIDIRLEVGDAKQTVAVTADVPLLETSNASAGQVITTEEVESFPLDGRTPLMLMQLAMGVVTTGAPGSTHPYDNAGPTAFSMGGGPSQSSELLIDGSPDATWDRRVAYNPPSDSVQEVRVHVFQTDASFGHTGSGTANQITKSGTNRFHGSAYEFNKTSALNAEPFFDNKNGIRQPVARYNQFGLTAGGPVLLPKVYDGRNKLFWFFAWEGIRNANPILALSPALAQVTVPTPAERGGDFSALLALGGAYQIYDPFSGVLKRTTINRTPLANNVIPASELNPVALSYLKLYPLPNALGAADGVDNYVSRSADTDHFNNALGRIDFNESERNKIFWSFRHNDRLQSRDNLFQNAATGTTLSRVNWGTTLDDVFIVNPTTVANVRLNWTRFIEVSGPSSKGLDPTSLGFPAAVSAASEYLQLPKLTFSGCGSSSSPATSFYCLGDTGAARTPFDVYQIFATVSKIHGNHSFKFGADVRQFRKNNVSFSNSSGGYTFNTNWTRGPTSGSASSPFGEDLASFLLGLPTSGQFDVNAFSSTRQNYLALFLQDDWRLRSNLTVNMGLRMEHEFPLRERYNRAVDGFDPSALLPVTAAAAAAYAQNPLAQLPASQFNARGGLTFAGAGHAELYRSSAAFWSPRVGLAWSPAALHGKTAVRTGIGIFMFPINLATKLDQEGYSQTTSFLPTLDNYLSPNATLSNPYPNGILTPGGPAQGAATFLGQPGVVFLNPNQPNPYSLRWEFGIQQQLGARAVLEAMYMGNHAVRLPVTSVQYDTIPGQYLSPLLSRDSRVINALSATVPNPFYTLLPGTTLNGVTTSAAQLLAPFPQFPQSSGSSNGVVMQNDDAGGSRFHSLNVRVQQRFSKGLSIIGNYMFSKLIEEDTRLNASDPNLERRISADNRAQHFALAAVYALPVGRGRALDFHSGWQNGVFGGWSLTGIYLRQSGAPLNFSGVNALYYGGPIHLNNRNVDSPAFDISRFNTNSAQQLSDNIRYFGSYFGNLRQDGLNNLDASLLKDIGFTERAHLQLRFEAFNTLNHPVFGAPNLTPTNKDFGMITTQYNLPRNIQLGARIVW